MKERGGKARHAKARQAATPINKLGARKRTLKVVLEAAAAAALPVVVVVVVVVVLVMAATAVPAAVVRGDL